MKFTVIGHASLYIEHKGRSLLVDPWLIGSCYWRSWWNFPEIDSQLIKKLNPDYIYLTHLHWDHFHAPSLKLFSNKTKILVPREPGNRMIRDLNSIDFNNIDELTHGRKYNLWEDFDVTSYQFGPFFIDSVLAISSCNTTLVNANDCKVLGLPLRQIIKNHPKIDFTFRSHSSASPLPYCIDNYQTKFYNHRTQNDYIEEFTQFCLCIGSKHAIPFASNHCYLHKDTLLYNKLGVSPDQVAHHYNQICNENSLASTCKVMSSGSSWSEEIGFTINEFDYEDKDNIINKMSEKHNSKLSEQYSIESNTIASFDSFQRYFNHFFKKIPSFFKKLLPKEVIFEIPDAEKTHYWYLNLHRSECMPTNDIHNCNFIIQTPAIVINDCTKKMMFSAWGPSKRLKIKLIKDETYSGVSFFFGLLDFYETDGFPLVTIKHIKVGMNRWREILTYINLFIKLKLFKKTLEYKELYKINPKLNKVST